MGVNGLVEDVKEVIKVRFLMSKQIFYLGLKVFNQGFDISLGEAVILSLFGFRAG